MHESRIDDSAHGNSQRPVAKDFTFRLMIQFPRKNITPARQRMSSWITMVPASECQLSSKSSAAVRLLAQRRDRLPRRVIS